jgi:TrmH family RNA methyltransferase
MPVCVVWQLLRVLESLPWSSVALVDPPSLLSACLDTVTPQGVAAILPQPTPLPLPSVQSMGQGGVVLVLDGVQDPGNVGTLIRSAAATGCRGVVCVGGGADPWGPKALRAAMGATFRLPVIIKQDWTGEGRGEGGVRRRRGLTVFVLWCVQGCWRGS